MYKRCYFNNFSVYKVYTYIKRRLNCYTLEENVGNQKMKM